MTDTEKLVNARGTTYGPPSVNFRRIALLWTAWARGRNLIHPGAEFTADDVAHMSIHIKQARLAETWHADGADDIAGYAETLTRLHESTISGNFGGQSLAELEVPV